MRLFSTWSQENKKLVSAGHSSIICNSWSQLATHLHHVARRLQDLVRQLPVDHLDDADGPAVDVGLVLLRVALPRLDARDHLVTRMSNKKLDSAGHSSFIGNSWSQLATHRGDVDGRRDELRRDGEPADEEHEVLLQQPLLLPAQPDDGREEDPEHLQCTCVEFNKNWI